MKASISNLRQSPRKVRLVASLIKGMPVATAELELAFLTKRAALPFMTLLKSAVANAVTAGVPKETLMVKEVRVDKGVTLKRMMPRARGSAYRINKRSSHILMTLAQKVEKVKPVKKAVTKKVSK
jgi:large subunit ribosomal protein L22